MRHFLLRGPFTLVFVQLVVGQLLSGRLSPLVIDCVGRLTAPAQGGGQATMSKPAHRHAGTDPILLAKLRITVRTPLSKRVHQVQNKPQMYGIGYVLSSKIQEARDLPAEKNRFLVYGFEQANGHGRPEISGHLEETGTAFVSLASTNPTPRPGPRSRVLPHGSPDHRIIVVVNFVCQGPLLKVS